MKQWLPAALCTGLLLSVFHAELMDERMPNKSSMTQGSAMGKGMMGKGMMGKGMMGKGMMGKGIMRDMMPIHSLLMWLLIRATAPSGSSGNLAGH